MNSDIFLFVQKNFYSGGHIAYRHIQQLANSRELSLRLRYEGLMATKPFFLPHSIFYNLTNIKGILFIFQIYPQSHTPRTFYEHLYIISKVNILVYILKTKRIQKFIHLFKFVVPPA